MSRIYGTAYLFNYCPFFSRKGLWGYLGKRQGRGGARVGWSLTLHGCLPLVLVWVAENENLALCFSLLLYGRLLPVLGTRPIGVFGYPLT